MNIIHPTIKFHNCDHNSVQPKQRGWWPLYLDEGILQVLKCFPLAQFESKVFNTLDFFEPKMTCSTLLWPSFVASVSCFWQVGWSKSKVALENGFLNYQTSYMHTIVQKLFSFCPSTMEIRSVCKFMDWFSEQSTILLNFPSFN